MGFAFAFSRNDRPAYKIGVYPGITDSTGIFKVRYVQFIPIPDLALGQKKISYHQLDLLVALGDTTKFWLNPTSKKGYFAEQILRANHPGNLKQYEISGKPVRYVDWLVPGVLAMSMMFSALFGVGWIIVRYRKNGYLKRLKATPLRAYEFLLAQVLSRLVVIVGSSTIVYAATHFLLNFTMNGSYILLFLVFSFGSFCMVSFGLLFASRFANEELVGGLLNFITWPMMFLSGVWFPLEGTHPVVQKISLIFPLTHVIEATRGIMIDGHGFAEISISLLVIIILSVVFISLASLLFKWE